MPSLCGDFETHEVQLVSFAAAGGAGAVTEQHSYSYGGREAAGARGRVFIISHDCFRHIFSQTSHLQKSHSGCRWLRVSQRLQCGVQ